MTFPNPGPGLGSVDALFSPASVAIVGASESSYVGRALCENLISLGFEGAIYPINPRYETILGLPCFASLDALPEGPDAVVAAVRVDALVETIRAAAKRGARAAVIPGAGFTETGPQALEVQDEVVAIAAEYGMAICGPNCMGVIAPGRRSAMYIARVPDSLLPGRVALVSMSGAVAEAASNIGPRVGFSAVVSCGNEAVTTVGEYLRYFAADDATGAVALFLEGFTDPQGFVDGARSLRKAGKPLAVLHAGRTEDSVAAITAHSGALAGREEVVTGLLHQLGAIGVDDLDELFEVAELLGHGKLPRGRRVFAVTDSGGESRLVADHAERLALQLPQPSGELKRRLGARWPNFSFIGNPIDPWGVDWDFRTLYGEVLDAAMAEDVDVVAVAMDKVTHWVPDDDLELGVAVADSLIEASRKAPDKVPVFFTVNATGAAVPRIREPLRAAGIPLLHGLRPALVAVRRAWYWQWWPPRSEAALPKPAGKMRLLEPGPVLSEWGSRAVLETYGIPLVEARLARTADEAAAAAGDLGYPVVLKGHAPGIAHKAARGLVKTGLPSAESVRSAFEAITDRMGLGSGRPAAVVVQPTASGVELICGMRRDQAFGPVVLVGAGGTLAEVLHDVAVRLCPPSPEDFEEMLDECAAGKLIAAVGADPAHVTDVLARLARLALDHPEIEEVDVNPLFAGPAGVAAADALVVLGRKS
jgi:acyl-CoA synthetase (NDP forming)